MEISNSYHKDANIVLAHDLAENFISTIPEQSVNLIISSPPYNVGKEYEANLKFDAYIAQQETLIEQLKFVLADTGSICWQVGNYVKDGEVFPLDMYYYPMFRKHGFILRNRIIWHYGHGLHARNKFSGRYETILWFTKSKNYVFNLDSVRVPAKYPGKRHYKGSKKGQPSGNPMGKNPSDVWQDLQSEWEDAFWEIPNVKSNHIEKTIHPCQYPVELAERCILALSNEEDWIFDPYAGVGSTLLAGIKNNRKVIGCEKEEIYIEISKQRIARYMAGDLQLRELGRPLLEPSPNSRVASWPEEWKTQE